MGAVFIPNSYTWSLEHDELDPDNGGILHLRRFPELLEHFWTRSHDEDGTSGRLSPWQRR